MSTREFLLWADEQETEHFELLENEVVIMAPERAIHNQAKLRIAIGLLEAVRRAGLPCQVFTDGMALVVDDATVFEPDAMVRCGEPLDGEATSVSDPVIIVEVRSPSTSRIDATSKLAHYFRVLSVEHYLIVNASPSTHLHFRRAADGWTTRLLGAGPLRLDPPGLTLQLD